jgi:TonB family protein
MKYLRLAFAVVGPLILTTAVSAQGQSAKTNPIAPVKTSVLESRSGTCPPAPPGEKVWFDTCEYLPWGNGVKLGRSISAPDPEYSESARKAKINGTVFLALAINSGGTVDAVKVVRSVEPGLDQNAMDAVKQWKFTPATKDGKPVAVQIDVTVEFKLY